MGQTEHCEACATDVFKDPRIEVNGASLTELPLSTCQVETEGPYEYTSKRGRMAENHRGRTAGGL